jgi:plastocyanin
MSEPKFKVGDTVKFQWTGGGPFHTAKVEAVFSQEPFNTYIIDNRWAFLEPNLTLVEEEKEKDADTGKS